MDAGAGQVQIFKALGLVVKAKPGRLGKQRRDGKARALIAQIITREIIRRHGKRRADMAGQPRQEACVQRLDDPRPQPGFLGPPVDIRALVRHGREHIKAVMPFGREAGIGGRRPVQIKRKIIGQTPPVEDIIQQALIARPEPDGVMRDLVIFAIRAEKQHIQPHRQLAVVALEARGERQGLSRQQMAIEVHRVPVEHDMVSAEHLAIVQPNALDPAPGRRQPGDGDARLDADTLAAQQALQRPHQGTRAAHRKKDPVGAFQIMDQGVNAGGVEWRAAEQQRLDRKGPAQLVML